MKKPFVPHGVYRDILDTLAQWRILDIQGLRELSNYDLKEYNLRKKVRVLEGHELIKGILVWRKCKYIFLTHKGLKYTPYDYASEIPEENIMHDLITVQVLRRLLAFPECFDGRVFHQVIGTEFIPDAEIFFEKDGEKVRAALEIELTRKNQRRVKEKFRRYDREKIFPLAIFVTNKAGIFKGYRKYLSEVSVAVQERIVLVFDEKLGPSKFDYARAICFYKGELIEFSLLFSTKSASKKGYAKVHHSAPLPISPLKTEGPTVTPHPQRS